MLKDIFKIKEFKKQISKLEHEKKDYETLTNELSSTVYKLQTRIKNLETQLNDKNSCKCKTNTNECLETVIDTNKFITQEYVSKFETAVDSCESSEDQLKIFNNYLNDEKIYTSAIVNCLDFIIHKKNKKEAIAKQLKKYLLTAYGKEVIEDLMNYDNE